MNKKITICMLAAITLAACTNGDELKDGLLTDELEVTDEQLASDVPIAFAPVKIADMQWEATVETEPTRGGSINHEDFTMDSLGVFCLAKSELPGAQVALTWSSSYSRIIWAFNEMAEVKGAGVNQGTVVWSEERPIHFYPSNSFYTYCFVAYHPWMKYAVVEKGNNLKAYIKVDGNDDVIHSLALEAETKFSDDDVNSLAFSKQYYDAIVSQGLPWDGTLPKFQFQHLMSRLDFSFRFDENDLPTKKLHVEKVEFNDFPCLLNLPLASFNKDAVLVSTSISPTSIIYVQNNTDSQLGKLVINNQKLKDIDPNFASAFGHFELREKGETPISGIQEGSEYKYNLTSEFKKVGDCILIPPVKNTHSKRNIGLYVTLADDSGHKYKNSTPIKLTCPTTGWGWAMGTSYDVRIILSNPLTHKVNSAPARRSASSTDSDGVTLWQPDAKVTITARQ